MNRPDGSHVTRHPPTVGRLSFITWAQKLAGSRGRILFMKPALAKFAIRTGAPGRPKEFTMPYEFLEIVELLASRTGQTTETVASKIIEGLLEFGLTEPGASVGSTIEAKKRYCKAEGIRKTREFIEGDIYAGAREACRRLLEDLRADPARKDYNGRAIG